MDSAISQSRNYRIKVEDGFGYIPIKDDIAQEELDSVINEVKDAHGEDFTIELVDNDSEFDSIKIYPRSMMDLLKDKLSEDEIADLNSAYDVIGDVVIVEMWSLLRFLKSFRSIKKRLGKHCLPLPNAEQYI